MELINIQELQKVDIRVGKVVRAEDLAEARKPTLKYGLISGHSWVQSNAVRKLQSFIPKKKWKAVT